MYFTCIKTGFYAKAAGVYLYGDAFAATFNSSAYDDEPHQNATDTLILRVCSMLPVSEGNLCHFQLDTWEHWFDELRGQDVGNGGRVWQPNSTIIASPGQWRWLGYKGVLL